MIFVMKKHHLITLVSLLAALAGNAAAAPENPFYAMDTAFAPHFRKTAPPLDESLALVKQLGFAGVAWTERTPEQVAAELAAIEKAGLRMVAIYSPAKVTPEGDLTHSPGALALMETLRGHCDILWIHIGGKGPEIASLRGDEPLFAKLRHLADCAQRNAMKVAIYPHLGEWTERFGDAVKLAKLVNHPAFGVSFNLCHALAAGEGERIPALLEEAGTDLVTATICGAEAGAVPADGQRWKKLIQPLGQGSYDTGALVRKLKAVGFAGPIGFQGYGIAGEPAAILTPTMETWKGY